MPYDIVDAYEDINTVNYKVEALIETLRELGVIPKEEKKEEKDEKKS